MYICERYVAKPEKLNIITKNNKIAIAQYLNIFFADELLTALKKAYKSKEKAEESQKERGETGEPFAETPHRDSINMIPMLKDTMAWVIGFFNFEIIILFFKRNSIYQTKQ